MKETINLLALVRSVWPDVSDELAEELLWSTTSFPMGTVDKIMEALVEYYEKSGGDPQRAMTLVDEEMAAEFDRMRQEKLGWTCNDN